MNIKTMVKRITANKLIIEDSPVYNHKGQIIEHIAIVGNNGIMLLTEKQYQRLLKAQRRQGLKLWRII